MIDIICILCGQNQQAKVLYPATFDEDSLSWHTYSARRSPDRVHYKILKCNGCGLVFSSPILPQSKLAKLYKDSSCSYGEQVPYASRTYIEFFNKIRKKLPKNPRILEIGCGNGFFLDKLMGMGINNVYGVDPSSKMVNEAPENFRKNIIMDIFRRNQFSNDYFDVVCCFHTLDHVVDPNEMVSEAGKILKQGGLTLFIVHDTNSLLAKIFKEKWPIFDIEHIYLFNRENLRALFLNNKFKNIETFTVRNIYPLSYFLKMAPFPAKVKKNLRKGAERLNLLNISVPLLSGNIGIIAQK